MRCISRTTVSSLVTRGAGHCEVIHRESIKPSMTTPLFVLCLALCLSTCLSVESLTMESFKAADGYEVFPAYNQSRYKLDTLKVNWQTGLDLCGSDGENSLLAVVNSDVEAAVVTELVSRVSSEVWVGIDDIAEEGTWVTVRGELLTESGYSKWAAGQPDQGTLANCGYVLSQSNALYWDAPCFEVLPFLCEKPNV